MTTGGTGAGTGGAGAGTGAGTGGAAPGTGGAGGTGAGRGTGAIPPTRRSPPTGPGTGAGTGAGTAAHGSHTTGHRAASPSRSGYKTAGYIAAGVTAAAGLLGLGYWLGKPDTSNYIGPESTSPSFITIEQRKGMEEVYHFNAPGGRIPIYAPSKEADNVERALLEMFAMESVRLGREMSALERLTMVKGLANGGNLMNMGPSLYSDEIDPTSKEVTKKSAYTLTMESFVGLTPEK